MKEYITKQGETWDMISLRMYGTEYHVTELILENHDYGNIVVFEGGELLRIPELSNTDTSLLAPWRR